MTIWGGNRVNLSKFKRGWLLLGAAETAHHYDRTDAGFVSACGRRFTGKPPSSRYPAPPPTHRPAPWPAAA